MNEYMKKMDASIKRAKVKLGEVRKEDALVFLTFTDLHTTDLNDPFTDKLLYALEKVNEVMKYDAVIDLGDNFSMLGRNLHITNDELEERFARLFSAIYKAAGHKVFHVNGNHDAIGTDFFKPAFWNNIVKGKYGNDQAVYGKEGSYYYIDYPKAHTRLVVVSLPHDSDITCEMPTPLWSFGEKQLNWLKVEALHTTNDVILISHVPFYYRYYGDMESTLGVWDGEKEKKSTVAALCGWITDLDEAMEIINDFNQRSDTRLITCLSGHTHRDSMWAPHEQRETFINPLPCVQSVLRSACQTLSGDAREIGASLEVVVWNFAEGKMHLIRIGDGADRCISV